jgi:hypothetical protein
MQGVETGEDAPDENHDAKYDENRKKASEAHLGHRLLSGVAHWLQNREPAALSVPQFEQRIALPGKQATGPSCITWRR